MSPDSWLQWQTIYAEYIQNSIRTSYIARIEKYDSTTRRANVKIMGAFEVDVDIYEEVPVLTDIPVFMLLTGDFFISMPLKDGDLGILHILSMDIDLAKTTGSLNKLDPNHNFNYSNSIFIPCFNPFNKSIPNHSADDLVIGKYNSGVTLTLTKDDECLVKQATATKLKLNTDGTWEIIGNTTITGNVTITGTTHSGGAISSDSTIAGSNVLSGEKSVNGHVHTNPEGGNTGAF